MIPLLILYKTKRRYLMAATIITVTKIGESDTNMQIKINDGHPIPAIITEDDIQSFRTWQRENDHLFIWTNDQGQEKSISVPREYVGWIISSRLTGLSKDRFEILAPCSVTVESEI